MSPQSGRRRHFHQELDDLQAIFLEMANRAEFLVAEACRAVEERDTSAVKALRPVDAEIDEMETVVDERVQELLALHQPMATDLRLVLALLKVSNDVERVAAHGLNIARAVRRMRKSTPTPELRELTEMGVIAREMLSDALAALVARNTALAIQVRRRDDTVDDLRKSLFRIMVSYMLEDPRNIGGGLEVLLISQNLERIADLATNISEDVIFLVEGRDGLRGLRELEEEDDLGD